MQKELASVLKGKLLTLPFVDLVAGLAQTLTTNELDETNTVTIQKRVPVSYDTWNAGACSTAEVLLIPDSSRKSIIYFEDYGVAQTGTLRGMTGFNSSLRLMVWLDRSKLVGDHYAEIAGRCQAAIIAKLAHKNPENIGMFSRLQVDVARIPPQEPALFGRYSYQETDRQYLRPPFEFFGIDLTSKFFISNKCLEGIPWNVQTCS